MSTREAYRQYREAVTACKGILVEMVMSPVIRMPPVQQLYGGTVE